MHRNTPTGHMKSRILDWRLWSTMEHRSLKHFYGQHAPDSGRRSGVDQKKKSYARHRQGQDNNHQPTAKRFSTATLTTTTIGNGTHETCLGINGCRGWLLLMSVLVLGILFVCWLFFFLGLCHPRRLFNMCCGFPRPCFLCFHEFHPSFVPTWVRYWKGGGGNLRDEEEGRGKKSPFPCPVRE